MKPLRPVMFALSALLLVVCPGRAAAQFFAPPDARADAGNYLFSAPAMGDVNGDRKSDIVALKFRSGQPAIWVVRINDGNGNFVATQELATGVNTTPTIADADSDGHADLLISFLGLVRVYWGAGDGTFPLVTEIITGTSNSAAVASIAVGNWNGDGYPDVAFAHRSSPTGVTVRYGLGNRQFDTAVTIADVAFATQVSAANIDGDSKSDLLVLAVGPVALGPPTVRVLIGANNLSYDGFAFTLGAITTSTSVAMTVADLNGDELTEAIVTTSGLTALAIAYPGGLPVSQVLSGVIPGGVPPAVTDVDGDGRVDIVVPDSNGTSATVLRAQDDGSFSATPPFSIANLTPRWTLFGDVDGDQALDIVTGGGAITTSETEIAVTLHVPPLRVSINPATTSAMAGTDGRASVSLVALLDSEHTNVSFSWMNAVTSEPLGTATTVTLSLPVGTHTFTVLAATSTGLKAVAHAVVTVTVPPPPPPPASETTVQGIQTTLDNRLDVAVSSRASQESLTQMHTALMSLGTVVQAQLDVPVSSRASSVDVAAIGGKVDQLKTWLPSKESLDAITQAVNALGSSMSSTQLRLAIELALSRGDRIASFYLPTSQGGQLDLVRSIVVDAADKSEAAGLNALALSKARRSITEGDARRAAGDYRTAYILYSAAYQILGG